MRSVTVLFGQRVESATEHGLVVVNVGTEGDSFITARIVRDPCPDSGGKPYLSGLFHANLTVDRLTGQTVPPEVVSDMAGLGKRLGALDDEQYILACQGSELKERIIFVAD